MKTCNLPISISWGSANSIISVASNLVLISFYGKRHLNIISFLLLLSLSVTFLFFGGGGLAPFICHTESVSLYGGCTDKKNKPLSFRRGRQIYVKEYLSISTGSSPTWFYIIIGISSLLVFHYEGSIPPSDSFFLPH